jgi:hypothetical protein
MIQSNRWRFHYRLPISLRRDALRNDAALLTATYGGRYRNVES